MTRLPNARVPFVYTDADRSGEITREWLKPLQDALNGVNVDTSSLTAAITSLQTLLAALQAAVTSLSADVAALEIAAEDDEPPAVQSIALQDDAPRIIFQIDQDDRPTPIPSPQNEDEISGVVSALLARVSSLEQAVIELQSSSFV